uniref:Nephrin n=1 Tax=Cacopsylla melanoneura TaxID=428564 RepID=A0A8D8M147_9HEMI
MLSWTMVNIAVCAVAVFGISCVVSVTDATKISDEETVVVYTAETVGGGSVKLPCNITAPENDKVSLVIWYKQGQSPIYSYDMRGKTEQAKHWADKDLIDRGFFKYDDSPAYLRIDNIRDADGGTYRCRVDFKKSPTRNSKVNLTVILQPDSLKILDENKNGIRNYILGPYNESSSVNITCIAIGGRPPPRVTWWQENALIDASYRTLSERRVENVLTLERLDRSHLNMGFTCQAANNNLTTPISSAVTLDMNLKPLWIKLLGENIPFSAEHAHQFRCEVVGARPTPNITWWRGTTQLFSSKYVESEDKNKTISILTYRPSIDDQGKTLECRVDSPLLDRPLTDSWKLNILHIPVVTLELGKQMNATAITETADVYFECTIKANPWVYKVTWRLNDMQLYNNISAGVIVSNQSLVLQNVSRARAGNYTCVGSNGEGDGQSKPVELNIKYAPVCRPGQEHNIGIARNEVAKINCEIEANPPALEFRWKFNNTSETTDIDKHLFTMEGTRSTITFTPSSQRDYGTLLCWARNPYGEQKHACVYHVIAAGPPDSLYNCSTQNKTIHGLSIECNSGFDGGLPQAFLMELYLDHSHIRILNVSASEPRFSVQGLESGVGYDIFLYAVNQKGRSEPTILQAHTLKSAEPRTAGMPVPIHITPLLGFLGAGVGALVFLACMIICLVRVKHRRSSAQRHSKISNDTGKESSDSVDSLEKNPDIIPQNNDYMDEDEKAFQHLNSTMYRPRITSLNESCNSPKDDVTYAELALPTSVYTNLLSNHTTTAPPQRKPPILYAQIDFNKEQALCGGHITAETPLILPPTHHNRESTQSTSKLETILEHNSCHNSNCQTSQPPVVTTTRF